ncbi:MAG: FAD-dependent oxidoreductase [Terrimicrobiaceae bacterium]
MKIAIIGAGLSGIAAARRLLDRGFDVTVFEKSRGWGGRCASKRVDSHIIDHGAQYFTLRDPLFQKTVEEACGENLLTIQDPIFDERGVEIPTESPRFYHRLGNSRLVRDLGRGIEVRTDTTVEPLDDLIIQGSRFDHILSTAPLPQTLKLAKVGEGAENPFVPCLCLILLYQGLALGRTKSAYAYSLKSEDSPVAWTACENHKNGRIQGEVTVLVVHASQRFSHQFLEVKPEKWSPILQEAVEKIWDIPSRLRLACFAHRWRYSRNPRGVSQASLPPGWSLAGDSLCESRVEAAWLSGVEISKKIG